MSCSALISSVDKKRRRASPSLPSSLGIGRASHFGLDGARANCMGPLAEVTVEVPMSGALGVMRGTATRHENAKGCVVLCHGFRSSRNTRLLRGLVEALDASGWSTARFDFPGNGDSDGEFRYGNYAQEAEAIADVVRHLDDSSTELELGTVRAVLGHSKGANSLLLYLEQQQQQKEEGGEKEGPVHGVVGVAVAGRYDVREGVVERFSREALEELETAGEVVQRDGRGVYKVSREGMRERMALDMPAAIARIGTRPEGPEVLVIHGTEDAVVPHEDAAQIAKALGKRAEIVLVPGADHNFAGDIALGQLTSSVVAFVNRATAVPQM